MVENDFVQIETWLRKARSQIALDKRSNGVLELLIAVEILLRELKEEKGYLQDEG